MVYLNSKTMFRIREYEKAGPGGKSNRSDITLFNIHKQSKSRVRIRTCCIRIRICNSLIGTWMRIRIQVLDLYRTFFLLSII